jgi:hypothetical protein
MSDPHTTVHAATAATAKTTSPRSSKPVAGTGGFAAHLAKATDTKADHPKGALLEKVAGHAYARVMSGPDKGLYVNQSDNARKGEAFRIVERGGHRYHVYGSGKDTEAFEVRK